MATSKGKKSEKAAPKAAAKGEAKPAAADGPFKKKRSTVTAKAAGDVLTPPPAVAEVIDAFRAAQDQAKYFEGEATVHKASILDYSEEEYAKRLYTGETGGFKVQGIETQVMYVIQDASAGLSEEDVEEFAGKWGKEAADDLIVRDFASIRFNDSVLEAHYDQVVKALMTLPPDIVDNLFKPMAMKARPGAAGLARRYAKDAKELREILRYLKLRQYVR